MTPEERALVLAALLVPLDGLPGNHERPIRLPRERMQVLDIDGELLDRLLVGDRQSAAGQEFDLALADVERATAIRRSQSWQPAPNPFAPVHLQRDHQTSGSTPSVHRLDASALVGDVQGDGSLEELMASLVMHMERSWMEAASFEDLIWRMLALEHHYLWFAPWSSDLDLPLPQSARLLAATALCRWRAGGGEDAGLRLVVGDLSGIQRYILAVTTGQDLRGSARRLRARSLWLQLLIDVAAHQTLHRLDLAPTNLIMSGGGRFTILAPATVECEGTLEELRTEWDHWLAHNVEGEVQINLAAVPMATEELAAAGDAFARAAATLGERKFAALRGAMLDENGWKIEALRGPVAHSICASCGRGIEQPGQERCPRCQLDDDVGRRLPRANRLAYRRDGGGQIGLLGWSVDILSPQERNAEQSSLIAGIHLRDTATHPDRLLRPLATHIPVEEGASVTFEGLAERARGRTYLGYLKMDVDRLGAIMAWGLRRVEGPGFDALARLMAISDWLEWFFGGYVAELAEHPEWTDIYLVFAGGDDLLALGPWDRALGFAARVREAFDRFSGANPGVTVSAGLAFGRPKYPMAQMVGDALDELKRAKEGAAGPERRGRNSFGLLDDCIAWEDWPQTNQDFELLADKEIASALLQVLLRSAELWKRFHQQNDLSAARFVPLMTYVANRTIDPVRQPHVRQFVRELIRLPLTNPQRTSLHHLGTTVRLAMIARRTKESDRQGAAG